MNARHQEPGCPASANSLWFGVFGGSCKGRQREIVAQVSNLLYRRLPAGRTVARENAFGPRPACGLEIRDTADWKSALLFASELRQAAGFRYQPAFHSARAAPRPVLGTSTETSRYWIVLDIARDPRTFLIVAHPVVIRLGLPEPAFSQTQHSFRPQRSKLFPAFHDLPHQMIRHRPEQNVDVIGHHNPFPQEIALAVKELDSSRHQFGNLRTAQVTRARTLVQMPLHLPPKVAIDGFLAITGGHVAAPGFEHGAQSRRTLRFVAQQDLARERICQPERDEILRALALDVGQVTSRVDAAALRVCRRVLDAPRAQLVTRANDTRVFRGRIHVRRIVACLCWCNPVAQVSNLLYRRLPAGSVFMREYASGLRGSADWKSAIQQVGNLRYSAASSLSRPNREAFRGSWPALGGLHPAPAAAPQPELRPSLAAVDAGSAGLPARPSPPTRPRPFRADSAPATSDQSARGRCQRWKWFSSAWTQHGRNPPGAQAATSKHQSSAPSYSVRHAAQSEHHRPVHRRLQRSAHPKRNASLRGLVGVAAPSPDPMKTNKQHPVAAVYDRRNE